MDGKGVSGGQWHERFLARFAALGLDVVNPLDQVLAAVVEAHENVSVNECDDLTFLPVEELLAVHAMVLEDEGFAANGQRRVAGSSAEPASVDGPDVEVPDLGAQLLQFDAVELVDGGVVGSEVEIGGVLVHGFVLHQGADG